MRSRPGSQTQPPQLAGSRSPDPSELPARAVPRLPVRRDSGPSESGDPMPHEAPWLATPFQGLASAPPPHGRRPALCSGLLGLRGVCGLLEHRGGRDGGGESSTPTGALLEFILETEAPALDE